MADDWEAEEGSTGDRDFDRHVDGKTRLRALFDVFKHDYREQATTSDANAEHDANCQRAFDVGIDDVQQTARTIGRTLARLDLLSKSANSLTCGKIDELRVVLVKVITDLHAVECSDGYHDVMGDRSEFSARHMIDVLPQFDKDDMSLLLGADCASNPSAELSAVDRCVEEAKRRKKENLDDENLHVMVECRRIVKSANELLQTAEGLLQLKLSDW